MKEIPNHCHPTYRRSLLAKTLLIKYTIFNRLCQPRQAVAGLSVMAQGG